MTSTVLITGAASGIGLSLAQAFAARRIHVTLTDHNPDTLRDAHTSLKAQGARVSSHVVDVTERQSILDAVAHTQRAGHRLAYIFNNAGVGLAAELRDTGPDDWKRILDVNLHGVIHGIDAAYPIMREQGSGHIVNISSLAGLIPLPGETAYVASKYAVVGLSHALRAEAAAFGVNVSVVCPGVVATPIYDTSPVIGFDKDKALSLWPKGISPDICAAHILDGVDRNRATIPVTPLAHLLWRAHRVAPSLFLRAATAYMVRMRQARTS